MAWPERARTRPTIGTDTTPALPIALAGAAVGVAAIALLEVGGAVLLAAAIGALCLLLPMLLFRDISRYWLFGYLFFLPFELGVRLTGRGVDMEALIDRFGVPPTSWTHVKLFPTDLVLPALFVWWLAGLRSGRFQIVFPRAAWLLVAAFVWSVLGSALGALSFELSLAQLVQDLKYLIVFFLFASTLRSRSNLRFVLGVLLATLAMESVASIALFSSGHARDSLFDAFGAGVSHDYDFLREQQVEHEPTLRASGTFGAASHLSVYLQFLIFLPFALAATSREPRRRLLLFALFGLAVAAEVLTLSRAGFLGMSLAAGLGLVILVRRGYVRARPLAAMAFIGLVAVLAQVPLVYKLMASRPETFYHRFTLFQEGGALIAAHPLLGVGANNSTAARLSDPAVPHAEIFASSDMPTYDNLYPIHNQFIVVAAENGLVGLALIGAFFALAASRALRLTGSQDRLAAALGIWLLCSYAAIGGQLLGDHFAVNAGKTMLWVLSAAVFAVTESARPDDTAGA